MDGEEVKNVLFFMFFRLPVMSDITSKLPEGTWRGQRLLTAVEGYSVTTLRPTITPSPAEMGSNVLL